MIFAKNEKNQSGFLLVEIMLALAVAVCAIAAAGLMAFAGQTMSVDSELDAQALEMAQRLIEEQRILAGDDFRQVNSTSTTEGIFSGRVNVSRHDFFVKSISAAVSWSIGGRNRQTEISALIADYGNTAGNDTCDSNLTGDWKNPQIVKVIDFSDFAESASSTYAIGDIDVYKGKLYVAMEKTGTKTDATFFVFDVSNPSVPILSGRIDNNNAAMAGINAITVNKNYAYAASATTNQFQIIDTFQNPLKLFSYKINNGSEAISIFYKNKNIYLGLIKADGPEFNIINATDPENPQYIAGIEIGAQVNDIYVKGDYAYLATADSARELIILDIANPSAPVLFAVYNLLPDQTNWGYGKSIQIIGDKIYFGRTYIANSPEFYLFDRNQSFINILGNYSENGVPFSVNDLIVRDHLAFILAGSASQGGSLRILDIDDPANIVEEKIIGLPGVAGGVGGAAMDCEGNYLYAASIDGAGKSYISIITAP
jgi:Tfp pilus assembly protein PilV